MKNIADYGCCNRIIQLSDFYFSVELQFRVVICLLSTRTRQKVRSKKLFWLQRPLRFCFSKKPKVFCSPSQTNFVAIFYILVLNIHWQISLQRSRPDQMGRQQTGSRSFRISQSRIGITCRYSKRCELILETSYNVVTCWLWQYTATLNLTQLMQ